MSESIWTDQRIATLRHFWATHSASVIANMIGVTRNAVIGKANRLGLQSKKGVTPLRRKRVKDKRRPKAFAQPSKPRSIAQ